MFRKRTTPQPWKPPFQYQQQAMAISSSFIVSLIFSSNSGRVAALSSMVSVMSIGRISSVTAMSSH